MRVPCIAFKAFLKGAVAKSFLINFDAHLLQYYL